MKRKIVLSVLLLLVFTFTLSISTLAATNINNFKDKSIGFLGDSVTKGTPYITYEDDRFSNIVADTLQFDAMYNYGIGSTTIADVDANSFVNRYTLMNDDIDYLFVQGGLNDFALDIPLGNITDVVDTTFYGALNNLADGLIAKYPNSQIIFMTPSNGLTANTPNTNGNAFSDFVDAVYDVGTAKGLDVLDMNYAADIDFTVAADVTAYSSGDGIHLNNVGHRIYSQLIISYLEKASSVVYKDYENLLTSDVLSTVVEGKYVDGAGTTVTLSVFSHTNYVAIDENTMYSAYHYDPVDPDVGFNTVIEFYDADLTFISSDYHRKAADNNKLFYFTTPANTAFVRFNMTTDYKLDTLFIKEVPNQLLHKLELNTDSTYLINDIYALDGVVFEEPTPPIKEGYVFDGWYIDKELSEVYDFRDFASEDVEIFAKWTESTTGVITPEAEPVLSTTEWILIGALIVVVGYVWYKKK